MNVLFWISFALLWLLVIIQGFAFLEVLRQIGQINKRLGTRLGARIMPGAIKAGDPPPELGGIAAHTLQPARWEDYLNPRFSVILLLSTHCYTCRMLAEDIPPFAKEVKDEAAILVIVQGRQQEVEELITKAKLPPNLVVIDEDQTTAKRFGVLWTPAAITIRQGKLGEASVITDIDSLSTLIYSQEAEHVLAQKV